MNRVRPTLDPAWRDEAEIALWDRRLVETLAGRHRAVERWACKAAFSSTPVSADGLVDRIRRLAVELADDSPDDAMLRRVAEVLAEVALDAVVSCLQDCPDSTEPVPVAG